MDYMRNIRQAKETDLDNIRGIVSSAINQCVTDSKEHQEVLYKDICSGLDKGLEDKDSSLLLVCEDGDSILGVALVMDYWNFVALFVDPARHRSGVGRDLVTAVLDSCKDRSPKGHLRLNSSNHAAAFYKEMGFKQIADPIDRPGGCIPFQYNF